MNPRTMQGCAVASTFPLFKRISAPFPAPAGARWFTWSAAARRTLRDFSSRIPGLPPPALEKFHRGEYGYSLAWNAAARLQPDLRTRLRAMAAALYRMPTPSLMLFQDLLDDAIDGRVLHYFLAFVRSELVEETADALTAIYAPLGAVGAAEKDFPLHADLYPPAILFNLFDDVPADGSGASLLLPMQALRRALRRTASIPARTRARCETLIARPSATDHYTEFYQFLHGDHPWRDDLRRVFDEAARVTLGRGQGYLVHDRRWLHGREAPRGGVSRDRLHRLIFDTAITRRARLAAGRRARLAEG